ncbi:MAG TPA: Si-specific NAD(P)(+) transhydrogenase [Candidatus Saccharimonadales bacterium]|nr:Si-specific NAD(P)(+) transhydrogenase [Candidatus Saccharimonadales bacterium]
MTQARSYDLVVIGSGPAGQRAAVQAAKLGRSAAVIERREVLGGVCVNSGTIPSKTLREAVLYLSGMRQRVFYGDSYKVKEKITAADLLGRCNMVVKREIDVIRAQLQRNGIDLIGGEARFVDPHTLAVDSANGESWTVRGEFIVIATGTRPAVPGSVKVDGHRLLTSDDVLSLAFLPRSLAIVGAGVIGMEYGSMFAALGTEVTIVDLRERVLEFIDGEILDDLIYQLRDMGCTFRLGERVEHVELKDGDSPRAVTMLKSGKKIISDMVLFSAGRIGATERLNLAAAGLRSDERGRLQVDAAYRTPVSHIFAAGDVIGFPSLASTSMEQGRLAACHAFGHETTSLPELFPFGIYAIPEISMVGQTEQKLTEAGVPYEFGVARYKEIARGHIIGDLTGLLKILFHRENRRVLGVHALGTGATELIHIGQAVMAHDGTIDYFVRTVFNYPTLAECYKVAALDGINKLEA